MSLNRKGTWLATFILGLLTGGPALAQGLRDAQIFAPAEPASYGGGVRPNQGFFFVYDELYWNVSAPQKATFGIDTNTQAPRNVQLGGLDDFASITQGTTFDTSNFQGIWVPGQRYELGQIYEHTGWLFSYFHLHEASQAAAANGVEAFFFDEKTGTANEERLNGFAGPPTLTTPPSTTPLNVYFDSVVLANQTRISGPEFNFLYRMHPGESGGIFEWYLGVRYLQFNEDFQVSAFGTSPSGSGVNSVLSNTEIDTFAQNNLIGPQIGLRYFINNDRWQFSTETKFMPAWNNQTVREEGFVASNLGANSFPRGINNSLNLLETNASYRESKSEFSPLVESRIEGKYQLTRAIAFKAGWTGMYIGHLARPSRMIDYSLHTTNVLGINMHENKNNAFVNGLTIGVEINR